MKTQKTFRFITESTPQTEITLNGRYGKPLSMNVSDGSASKTIVLDTESVIRLQTFLSDYLQTAETASSNLISEPTGRALAVMDGDTLETHSPSRARLPFRAP